MTARQQNVKELKQQDSKTAITKTKEDNKN